jgi:hypothetical protein
LLAHRAETPAAQFVRQDRIVNGFQQARAKRRMNTESGIDSLFGNGVLGHAAFFKFLAKTPRRKERNCDSEAWLIPPVVWTDDFGIQPNH